MIQRKYLPTYTYADYVRWEGRWELIHGIPYAMSPAPALKHQRVNMKLAGLFDSVLEDCKKCEVYLPIDWKIDEKTVVQPDISVVCGEPNNENYLDFAPELVVEILSPSNAIKDLNLKYEIYEAQAVRYYVIIDPKKETVTIHAYLEGKFEEVKVFRGEIYTFELGDCEAEIDFAKIWL